MNRALFAAASIAACFAFAGCYSKNPATPTAPPGKNLAVNDEVRALQEGVDVSTAGTRPPEPVKDFVLISPLRSTETYLLNEDHQVVHRWKTNYPPAALAYFMENGDLLRCARDPDFDHFRGGGIGAMVERYS